MKEKLLYVPDSCIDDIFLLDALLYSRLSGTVETFHWKGSYSIRGTVRYMMYNIMMLLDRRQYSRAVQKYISALFSVIWKYIFFKNQSYDVEIIFFITENILRNIFLKSPAVQTVLAAIYILATAT